MTTTEFIKQKQNDVLLEDYSLQDMEWFMTEYAKHKNTGIQNDEEYKEAIVTMEVLGDLPCFETTPALVRIFDKLADIVAEYERINYPM